MLLLIWPDRSVLTLRCCLCYYLWHTGLEEHFFGVLEE